jgi:hypothetical protein
VLYVLAYTHRLKAPGQTFGHDIYVYFPDCDDSFIEQTQQSFLKYVQFLHIYFPQESIFFKRKKNKTQTELRTGFIYPKCPGK